MSTTEAVRLPQASRPCRSCLGDLAKATPIGAAMLFDNQIGNTNRDPHKSAISNSRVMEKSAGLSEKRLLREGAVLPG